MENTPIQVFQGIRYNVLSRADRTKRNDSEPVNFGDYISDIAKNYELATIASFIRLNIAARDPKYKGLTDTKRKAFLDFMVASNVLVPIKVGSQKGYIIKKKPSVSDLQNAYNFATDQSENGKGFAAFESGDPLRYSTMKKSIRLETYLINTFIDKWNYGKLNIEYKYDNFFNDFIQLFTVAKVTKLIDWFIVKGVMSIRYVRNNKNELTGKYIKFNKNIDPTDLDNIPLEVFIPKDCPYVTTTKESSKYFDTLDELIEFFKENINYLCK